MKTAESTGTVLEIQRMSTEDGPGIRTTVFLKGCSLRCTWCHNPESMSRKPQIQWIASRCIGCRTCIDQCSRNALSISRNGVVIDRSVCDVCGDCIRECPSTAMELLGTEWSAADLVLELKKDRAYFEKSGGGITVSGGEPTVQAPFAAEILRQLMADGIHTALDTCGLCRQVSLDMLLPYASMVLFDIKLADPEAHKTHTGSSNTAPLENLRYLTAYMQDHLYPRKLWIRTPLIPGVTASTENIRGIGRIISALPTLSVDRWELCAFNNLCRDKYARLGLEWPFQNTPLLSRQEIESLTDEARRSGVDPKIVHWSGSTRLEDSPEATVTG